jgi:HEAT repeat protein
MLAGILLACVSVGCGLRTVPPVRYIPLVGAEKKIATTAVLARALQDRDVSIRAQTVKLLGVLSQSSNSKVKKEVARVLGMAARDSDPGIRLLAIEILGQMEEQYGNRYLRDALKDPNPFIRSRVLKVLEDRQAAQTTPAPQTQATTPPATQP